MTRILSLVSLVLAISIVPGGLAGPACSQRWRGADCIQRCKTKWGWPGGSMGTDPWGPVMKAGASVDLNAVVSQACGVASATPPAAALVPATSSSVLIPATSSPVLSTVDPTTTTVPTSVLSSTLTSSVIHSTSTVTSSRFITSSTRAPSVPVSTFVVSSTSSSRPSERSTTSTTPIVIATTQQTTSPLPPPRTTSKAPEPTPSALENSSGGSPNSDIEAYLAGHNTIRAKHGAVNLIWSDELASKAQQWANGCKFEHSGGSLGPYGENLAAGTADDYSIATAIKSWTDEVKDYNAGNPQASHFTQVVWKGTTQVGCAVQLCDGIFSASFGKAKYHVCEYSAQGNIIGQFAQNVQA